MYEIINWRYDINELLKVKMHTMYIMLSEIEHIHFNYEISQTPSLRCGYG